MIATVAMVSLAGAFAVEPGGGSGSRTAARVKASILTRDWSWIADLHRPEAIALHDRLLTWAAASPDLDTLLVRLRAARDVRGAVVMRFGFYVIDDLMSISPSAQTALGEGLFSDEVAIPFWGGYRRFVSAEIGIGTRAWSWQETPTGVRVLVERVAQPCIFEILDLPRPS